MVERLSDQQQREMAVFTEGCATKAAKIRALDAAGYKRADIARCMGVRYQHVRNVLLRKREHEDAKKLSVTDGQETLVAWGRVGPDGRLLIPPAFRQKLGIYEDGHVLMRIENGEFRLMNRQQALDHARELVAKYVPEGESLVDSLIADRRAEVAREQARD